MSESRDMTLAALATFNQPGAYFEMAKRRVLRPPLLMAQLPRCMGGKV